MQSSHETEIAKNLSVLKTTNPVIVSANTRIKHSDSKSIR